MGFSSANQPDTLQKHVKFLARVSRRIEVPIHHLRLKSWKMTFQGRFFKVNAGKHPTVRTMVLVYLPTKLGDF